MEQNINEFFNRVKSAKSIVIMGHKNPDGDSLCSVLALAHLIEENFGVRPVCVYDGNIPDCLDLIPLRTRIKFYERIDLSQSFDLAIVMDYGSLVNIGGPKTILDKAQFVIEIDHHINENTIGDLCLNDDKAPATAVLVYKIMRMGNLKMDADVADLLALGILTDTGNFKFVRTGDALRIMADLVDGGVNIRGLIESMNNKPRKAVQLEARTAGNAEFFYHGRLALATIVKKDYKNLDGRGEMVLSLLGQIQGVDYIVLLKEQKPEQIGVSIRSRRKPIDHVAVALGGGGHERAAGAVVRDSLENVRARILDLFKEELK
ncbi:MAG: bifunctional oligoribonuclease/PAP phosphatase NrnA [Alphaproteobacteria bacterium]|nr:bifunctional oligoribonuclease/PAP phosphatase NrnA [Alphaproteobacteria bacterium]